MWFTLPEITCSLIQSNLILCHDAVFCLGAVGVEPEYISMIIPGSARPPARHSQGSCPLDVTGCFGKCQLLAPKGLIWRSSVMEDKDEVCIHVPFQGEGLRFGDMSTYRKRKARGVLSVLFCFPWWLISVINVPWSEKTHQAFIFY